MTPYENLDIDPDASADEIKQAFRRAAMAAHPDRGGSAASMADVNAAYELLSDPARRARYDETGDDQAQKPAKDEARDMLLTLFNAALVNSDGNWLREVSEMLGQNKAGLLQLQNAAGTKLDRLVKRTGKIKVKAGENLVQMLIDQKIVGLRMQIANTARGLLLTKAAAAMLAAYEEDGDGTVEPTQQAFMQHLGIWR